MIHNLKSEMARRGIKNSDIATAIGANEKTFRNKLFGVTSFNFKETKIIRDQFFPTESLAYLFEEDSTREEK